ncbi:MAG: hypothetical protein JNJ49_09215 [Bdellovibrionaceae bacterium]|nr:hypothetical protein [Pseudobdellovibrionaceae bacterium]
MREHKKPKTALSKKEKKLLKMNENSLKLLKGNGQGSGGPPANSNGGKAAA